MLWHAVSEAILEQATKGIPDTSKRSRKRQPKTVCIRNLLYIFQSREPYRIFKSCKESTRASNLRLMYPPRVHFTSDVSSTTRSKDTSPRSEKKNRLVSNGISFHFTHTYTNSYIYIYIYILRTPHSEQKDIRSKFEYSSVRLSTCTSTIEGAIRRAAIGGIGGWVW